jgi:hypothetical protein
MLNFDANSNEEYARPATILTARLKENVVRDQVVYFIERFNLWGFDIQVCSHGSLRGCDSSKIFH